MASTSNSSKKTRISRGGLPKKTPPRISRGGLPQKTQMRLNQYIASCGVCSRRKADELIAKGQVIVNSKKDCSLGQKVSLFKDKVLVNGKPIRPESPRYFVLYKPTKVLSTLEDPMERPTVADLFPRKLKTRLFPVGRLDWNSEGMMLITNDGPLAHIIMHPSFEITKVYQVKIDGLITDAKLEKLKKGLRIEGQILVPQKVRRLIGGGERKSRKSSKYSWLELHITEGKYHIIRKMMRKLGFDTKKLKRVGLGQLKMGKLEAGEMKEIDLYSLQKVFKTPK